MKVPISICIVFLTSIGGLKAQKHDKEFNEYFILGSLNDYMGRNGDPRFSNHLDNYFGSEGVFFNVLDSVLSETYPSDLYKVNRTNNQRTNHFGYEIYSDSLKRKYDQFYDFKPSGSMTAPEGKVIYTGVLKNHILKNDKQKLAFIAGAYARFGISCDTAYCISLANSTSKINVLTAVLNELNCNPYYKISPGIPVGHKVYFHPTKKVLGVLQPYLYLTGAKGN